LDDSHNGEYGHFTPRTKAVTRPKDPPLFHCERCESSFNATVAAAAGDCPRCKKNDDVASPLRFRLFEPSALKIAGISPARTGAPVTQGQTPG
jgi:hypothetical protein